MTDIDLGSRKLFTEQPAISNYATISAVVSSGMPISNIFNGQNYLLDIAKNMIARAQSNVGAFSFNDISKVFQFKMYKVVKPKVTFSAYISRVLPDTSLTNIQTSSYYPVVQFKIDYDACCVGSMMLLLTTDVQVRSTLGEIPVHGFSSNGSSSGVTLSYQKDVKSIQYAYCKDFIYHYIDRISIGWANTGGNAPVWHQEIPIEIAKIYHSLLVPPGMSEVIKRSVRNDMTDISHDCHREYGDFSFSIKSPASIPNNTQTNVINGGMGVNFGFNQQIQSSQSQYSTSNELAMYWNDTQIKEVGFGGLTNVDSYSNPHNIQISFKDPKQTGSTLLTEIDVDHNKTKTISKMELSTELYWRFGSESAKISITSNGNIYQMTNSMSYIPIVSSEEELKTLIDGLNENSSFPQYINTIDADTPYTETIYLVPYVVYSTDAVSFNTALVSKLENGKYYVSDGEAGSVKLEVPGETNPGMLNKPFIIAVMDGNNSGSMTYSLGTSTQISTAENEYVNTILLISKYKLRVDGESNTFIIDNMSSDAMYLDNTAYVNRFVSIDSTSISEGNTQNGGFRKCTMSSVGGFGDSQETTLSDFMASTIETMGSYLLETTGALSPVMQQANIAYINIVTKPYDENDLMLNSPSWYMTSNGSNLEPRGSDRIALYRYNSSIAANGQSEENYPSIQNVDDISIHTFRKNHGIVDFYFPLQFLFICQDVSQSFPHYACSAQSILIKFDFNNIYPFIDTSISVRPLAMDPLDYGHKERILINRVNQRDVLESNVQNTKFLLFFTRYTWIPELQPILANYKYYSWVINNYERFYKQFTNLPTNQEITAHEFNKTNFYTKIWVFITNRETIETVSSRGQQEEYIPISINRYKLEAWDKMRYGTTTSVSSQGAQLTGATAQNYINQQNSVYFEVPFESCQLFTKSSIGMTDEMPYRAEMLAPYLMLEHQHIHSRMEFNNLLIFSIDSVLFQEGFPNLMYSPAYAPEFELKFTTKSGEQQDFGAIIITECKNVSYIANHVMLLKYSTSQ